MYKRYERQTGHIFQRTYFFNNRILNGWSRNRVYTYPTVRYTGTFTKRFNYFSWRATRRITKKKKNDISGAEILKFWIYYRTVSERKPFIIIIW